ncbi:uncharacterized protein LOC108588816 isoform X2 [Callithrix jacchus]
MTGVDSSCWGQTEEARGQRSVPSPESPSTTVEITNCSPKSVLRSSMVVGYMAEYYFFPSGSILMRLLYLLKPRMLTVIPARLRPSFLQYYWLHYMGLFGGRGDHTEHGNQDERIMGGHPGGSAARVRAVALKEQPTYHHHQIVPTSKTLIAFRKEALACRH